MKWLISILFLLPFSTSNLHGQTFSLTDTTVNIGDVYRTNEIFFEFASETLLPESMIYLDSVAGFLKLNEGLRIEIGVHCDERWSEQYSICLTCKRAKAIAEYLVSKGIEPGRLETKGYNDDKPLIPGAKTEEEHQKNRRVEFIILSADFEKE